MPRMRHILNGRGLLSTTVYLCKFSGCSDHERAVYIGGSTLLLDFAPWIDS
jgi:hypothetical protein